MKRIKQGSNLFDRLKDRGLRCRRKSTRTIYTAKEIGENFVIEVPEDNGNKELKGEEGEYILFIPGGGSTPIGKDALKEDFEFIEDEPNIKNSGIVGVSGKFESGGADASF